ncbi:SLC18B1 [Branchiostoma lanceolatum]|uniref:SLC18B1 protein n=1 Tax=Branchiostoma lanceolatum TaxID=7740 RepID=A0A8J9Z5E5_BRALA|nr:SLC18B1 [Branchiostoma lanceolatum]
MVEESDIEAETSGHHCSSGDTIPLLKPPDGTAAVPSKELPPMTGFQKKALVCLSYAYCMGYARSAIMAPFFPSQAAERGASETIVGFIFGYYSLIAFLTAPIVGKLTRFCGNDMCPAINLFPPPPPQITRTGPRFMFLCGSLVGMCVWVLTGVSGYTAGGPFIGLCFAVFTVEGFCYSAFEIALMATVARVFPKRVSTVMGTMEIFIGVGTMLASPAGGALFEWGGYLLPFVVAGLLLGSCAFVVCIIPSNAGKENVKSGSLTRLATIPDILVVSGVIFAVYLIYAFLDPTLEPHLTGKFGISQTEVGVVFMVGNGAHALASPFWGWLADRYVRWTKVQMTVGVMVSALAFTFLGPAPFYGTTGMIWEIYVAQVVFGIAKSAAIVPTYAELLRAARAAGMPDDLGTYGVISGLYDLMMNLG